jgi:hypothetical protein
MAIVAPLSKYKKQNFMIFIAVLVVLGSWFGYDGYFNKTFIEDHVEKNELGEPVLDEEGNTIPDSDLAFNRKSPPYFFVGALLVAIRFFMVKGRKVVAGDTSLQTGNVEIPYDSIEKINKTFFDKKGYFIITYKDGENESELKLSDRSYDNMPAVLDEIVKQIS